MASATFYYWYDVVAALQRKESPTRASLVGYLLSAIVTCYVHYFGLMLVAILAGYGLLVLRYDSVALKRWVALTAVLLLAYLPWIPTMMHQMASHEKFWIPDPSFFGKLIEFRRFAFRVPVWWFSLAFVPAYLLFFASLRRRRGADESEENEALGSVLLSPAAVLLMWLITPFVASYLQSKIATPVMTLRNLIILLPPTYLILARGIWSLRWKDWASAWAILVVTSVLAITVVVDGYYRTIKKQQFREAAAFVIATDGTEIEVPIVAYAWHKKYFEYYFERMGSPAKVDLIAGKRENISELEELLASSDARAFWLVVGHRVPEPEFLAYLSERYGLVDEELLRGASARKYVLR
jgi:hypothetical protein